MRYAWLCALAIGCGSSSNGGEAQLGTATLMYGTDNRMMTTGSAIQDPMVPANMRIQLGTDNVRCGTDLDANMPPSGTYIYFSVDKTTPMANQTTDVNVEALSSSNFDFSGATGMATITAIDTRVMGSLVFSTTDAHDKPIMFTGEYDVKKCF
jgi:hypothetical protein